MQNQNDRHDGNPKMLRKAKKNRNTGIRNNMCFLVPYMIAKKTKITPCSNIHGLELSIMFDPFSCIGAHAWKTIFCYHFAQISNFLTSQGAAVTRHKRLRYSLLGTYQVQTLAVNA